MPTTSSDDARGRTFPFVGREKVIERLRELHRNRRHVLLLGPEGAGKTALVAQLSPSLGLRVCPASDRLSWICAALECEFGLSAGGLALIQRKNRVLKLLNGTQRAVVFDGTGWTTPRLGNFIESVSDRVPVWLCARSGRSWDIGRIWPLLARFEQVELKPLHPGETRLLIAAAVRAGKVPNATLNIAVRLHRRAAGNPKILIELLAEIARGGHDLSNPLALRRLDLDRRIHNIFPGTASWQAQTGPNRAAP